MQSEDGATADSETPAKRSAIGAADANEPDMQVAAAAAQNASQADSNVVDVVDDEKAQVNQVEDEKVEKGKTDLTLIFFFFFLEFDFFLFCINLRFFFIEILKSKLIQFFLKIFFFCR